MNGMLRKKKKNGMRALPQTPGQTGGISITININNKYKTKGIFMMIRTFPLHHGDIDNITGTNDYVYTPNWGAFAGVPCTFTDVNLHSAIREVDRWYRDGDIPWVAAPSRKVVDEIKNRQGL